MYADYQEFAAGFARQCYERRKAEEEAQYERDKLAKPVTAAADVRKTGPGAGLIHKTRDNARVADDDGASVERRASAKSGSEMAWWEWVDKRIGQHLEGFAVEAAEGMAEFVGKKVSPLKRELELQRRELDVLRMEVNVKALQEEVRAARAAVPKLPEIVAELISDLESKQVRLERELAKVKDRTGKLKVDQMVAACRVEELRKTVEVNSAASVEVEFESERHHFAMRATHPAAARALKEFATGIINGQADGTLWLPGRAGNA